MSLKARIDAVVEKLKEFQEGTDDSQETTPVILRNAATFIEDELGDMIDELEEISRELCDQ
ncbi:hypothetical protein PV433_16015 [Paenibacillus sp. GYB004]|uniref:hypothetical protein n=1 Tax=Paenibacillus sp. GYB004 TaxID=2994393 RepID=UPI002F96167C